MNFINNFTTLTKSLKSNFLSFHLEDKDFDLIYCAGLFDYLSDPVAKITTRKLYDALKPKGKLIIGNFSITYPHQFGMDLVLD